MSAPAWAGIELVAIGLCATRASMAAFGSGVEMRERAEIVIAAVAVYALRWAREYVAPDGPTLDALAELTVEVYVQRSIVEGWA